MTMAAARQRTTRFALIWRILAALLLIAVVLVASATGDAPRWLGLYYLGLGGLSAGVYWWDKRAAIAGNWRVPETTLIGIDLAGGIIGGLMSQIAWRHKTAKRAFGIASAAVVIIHLCGFGALLVGVLDAAK